MYEASPSSQNVTRSCSNLSFLHPFTPLVAALYSFHSVSAAHLYTPKEVKVAPFSRGTTHTLLSPTFHFFPLNTTEKHHFHNLFEAVTEADGIKLKEASHGGREEHGIPMQY